ncbi:MAG: tRNA (5-methylaminomethyl-2-thiouridine)(34)-methyltransferase MnmD [Pedobacter sp.]|nr:tRNA (5-methylaminomethyl-2-thiouridine)(34)-methyltransferase MnmD [Pedobacter sp.]MDQ8053774.1 tRNA (5-methylaminomethyl-2-thiouridine)(34)-methyltransferase MnmD [Pedobacter sp.]
MNILAPTNDGSNTLFNEMIGEHYHSAHGALQESKHVFIDAGLKYAHQLYPAQDLSILEVGFGTGLNFILSFAACSEWSVPLNYTGIEAFPLSKETIQQLDYEKFVPNKIWESFIYNYENSLIDKQKLIEGTELAIIHQKLLDYKSNEKFDIIYYDAFSVRHQPEMWTDEVIAHACSFLKDGGIFVSYAITGNLKRALKKCGLQIEKLPGAPGKREMIRGQLIVYS